jgi:DNA uptake protein ComE-like DNA-binding protein
VGSGKVAICILTLCLALDQLAAAQQPSQQTPAPSKADTSPSAVQGSQTPAAPSASMMPPAHAATTSAKKSPAWPPKKVDLNNATLEELKSLPTVTDVYAKKIIANRPYKSKGELVTKAKLPEGVYYAVRHHVEMQKPRKAASTK